MLIVDIYMNEITNFSIENYSFETLLHVSGTVAQIKNIKTTKGIQIGQQLKLQIKDIDNTVIETCEGILYLMTTSVQTLYGAVQSSLAIAVRH